VARQHDPVADFQLAKLDGFEKMFEQVMLLRDKSSFLKKRTKKLLDVLASVLHG